MSVPSSNLLAQALRVIKPSAFQYVAYQSRTTNSIGLDVATYAAPVTLRGSIQPVPRNIFEQYGLDFQKSYIWVYVQKNISDIDRDRSSDRIIFNGKTYQILSNTEWYPIDGWSAFICVYVPNA
jgi:hypothetical protein